MATTRRIVPHSLEKLALLALAVGTAALAGPDDAVRALSEVPGFDFSRLTAPAKRELASVFTDEFDYCGRPLTLLASLKRGDACKHTRRLAGLAALQAEAGTPASEIVVALARYNQSFLDKRVSLKVDERLCRGASAKDARVTLAEFSDFECPYCALARPMLEDFVKGRPAVRLCFMPFPLSGHAHAMLAGQAALFARDSGKFWQLHDLLFENQLSLSEQTIRDLVKKAGLDPVQFQKALDQKRYLDELAAAKEAGKNAAVDSTPTVFVNGRKLSLTLSPEALALTVDDELDWLAGNNAWPGN